MSKIFSRRPLFLCLLEIEKRFWSAYELVCGCNLHLDISKFTSGKMIFNFYTIKEVCNYSVCMIDWSSKNLHAQAYLIATLWTFYFLQVPKATIDVKELTVDISKIGDSNTVLLIKLRLLPFLIHICDGCLSYDSTSDHNQVGCLPTSHHFSGENSPPFVCEDLSVVSEFGHERYFFPPYYPIRLF